MKPKVEAKLRIKGDLTLSDIENIMLKLLSEFGIKDFQLQIDGYMNSADYQNIQLHDIHKLKFKPKKQYVWILDVGVPQPFNTKQLAELHKSKLLNDGTLLNNKSYPIYKKLIIVNSEGKDK